MYRNILIRKQFNISHMTIHVGLGIKQVQINYVIIGTVVQRGK